MAEMGCRANRGIDSSEGVLQRSEGQRLRDASVADRVAPGQSWDAPPRPGFRIPASHGPCSAAAGSDGVLPGTCGRGPGHLSGHTLTQGPEGLFISLRSELAGLFAAIRPEAPVYSLEIRTGGEPDSSIRAFRRRDPAESGGQSV